MALKTPFFLGPSNLLKVGLQVGSDENEYKLTKDFPGNGEVRLGNNVLVYLGSEGEGEFNFNSIANNNNTITVETINETLRDLGFYVYKDGNWNLLESSGVDTNAENNPFGQIAIATTVHEVDLSDLGKLNNGNGWGTYIAADLSSTGSSAEGLEFNGDKGQGNIILGATGSAEDGNVNQEVTINGGKNSDDIAGDMRTEMIFAGGGDDNVRTSGGDDTIDGEAGDDKLDGRSGDDSLIGGPGNDNLTGGTGSDILKGGGGDDILDGGTGADIFRLSPGNDTILDFNNIGEDYGDVIALPERWSEDYRDKVSSNFTKTKIEDTELFQYLFTFNYYGEGEETDTLKVISDSEFTLEGAFPLPENSTEAILTYKKNYADLGYKVFSYIGDDNPELITTDTLSDFASEFYDDNDRYESALGQKPKAVSSNDKLDRISGEGGNDTIEGGANDDVISGGDGADSIKGGDGNDSLNGDDGDDILNGGNGNDQYILSEGNDTILGYKDSDKIIFEGEFEREDQEYSGKKAVMLTYKIGGTEASTLVVTNDDIDVIPDPDNGGGNSGGGGGNGGGNGGGGGSEDSGEIDNDFEDLPGDNAGDSKPGGDGTIEGKPINPPAEPGQPEPDDNELRVIDIDATPKKSAFDSIKRGSQKADTVIGSGGVDKLRAQKKADLIKGKSGADYLYGEDGSDTLIGGKGADVLQGGRGKDELNGWKGNDVLYGGNKADVLTGNAGKDTFILSRGNDVITDFKVKKDAIGLVYALDLKFKQKGDDLMITGNDSVRTLLLDVDKEKFLANFPENLEIVPAVEINLI